MKTGRLFPPEDGPSPGLFDTHVSSFLTQLRSEGYAERTLRKKRSVAASFALWSKGKYLGMDDLNESHLAAFMERSPRRHKARVNFELAALRPFLEYLRAKAGAPPPPLPTNASPADEIEHDTWTNSAKSGDSRRTRFTSICLSSMISSPSR